MTYLLQIFNAPALSEYENLSEEEQKAVFGEYMAIAQAPGVLGGHQLQPAETATTVRVQDGQTLTTDGPFAETKEQVGGFCLIEAADLDEAVAVAAEHPAATYGTIEVRELWPPL
jgi:hypothetical protein